MLNRSTEIKVHVFFHFLIHISKYDIIDIRAEVTHRCIEQLQLVLHAELLKLCTCRRKHPRLFPAVTDIDLIHVVHQIDGFLSSDMLVERTTEVVCDIVFSIGKCARTAKAAHDRTGRTLDAGLYLLPVDRAAPLLKRIAGLKHSELQLRALFHQLIGAENTAGTSSYDNDIIIFISCSFHI